MQIGVIKIQAMSKLQIKNLIIDTYNHRFDLSCSLLVRAFLRKIRDQEHVLIIVAHHIAIDATSIPLFLKDLTLAYSSRLSGGVSNFEPLPVTYFRLCCVAASITRNYG